MANKGVTEDQVARAADELLLAGERPTIERVRTALGGTGSQHTLVRHMDAWWKRLGLRLKDADNPLTILQAPAEVSEAASDLWRIALAKAREAVEAVLADERDGIATQRAEIEAMRTAASGAVEDLKAAAAAARAEADAAGIRIKELEADSAAKQTLVAALHDRVEREQQHVARLQAELTTAHAQIDTLHKQAASERESNSTYLKTVEDRASREIDRARGEAAAAQRRIAALEKQVRDLQTEARDLQVEVRERQAEATTRYDALVAELRRAEAATAALQLQLTQSANTPDAAASRRPRAAAPPDRKAKATPSKGR